MEIIVSLAVRSLMALSYANFHYHNAFLTETATVGPHGNEFFDFLKTSVATFRDELDGRMKQLYGDLVLGVSPLSAAEELVRFLEESLLSLGRVQATIRQYALALKNVGKDSASEKVGDLSAKAGDLTRHAFAAHAASYYLSMQSKLDKPETKANVLLNKSHNLRYDTDFPN